MTQTVKPNFSNNNINAQQKAYIYAGSATEPELDNNTAICDMPDYEFKEKSYVESDDDNNIYEGDGCIVSEIGEMVESEEAPIHSISDAVRENQADFIKTINEATREDGSTIVEKASPTIGKAVSSAIDNIIQKIKKKLTKKYNKYNGDNHSIPLPKYDHAETIITPESYPYGPEGEVVIPGYEKTSYYDKDGNLIGTLKNGIYTKIDTYDNYSKKSYYRYDEETNSLMPFSPYDDDNINSRQYGGNQNVLSQLGRIVSKETDFYLQEMQKIAPEDSFDTSFEATKFYNQYAKFLPYSCGYISACNTIFTNYIGREDEFKQAFGYPMYAFNENTGEIDYNYEQLEVQFFNYVNGEKIKNLIETDNAVFANGRVEDKNGEVVYLGYDMKDFENFAADHGVDCQTTTYKVNIDRTSENEKNINKALKEAYLKNDSIILTTGGYDLYDVSGNLVCEGGGGHSMQLVGFNDKGQPIVSSWGEKFIIDVNGESGGHNEVDYLELNFTAVNFDNFDNNDKK